MSPLQARAALVMFESRHFDTADIAELLGVPEAVVARTLTASRDLVREMYRDHVADRPVHLTFNLET